MIKEGAMDNPRPAAVFGFHTSSELEAGAIGYLLKNVSGDELAESSNVTFKGDINEELVRLKTHVSALGKTVREREPVGKRIDFMLQEVNRELNTISSKVPFLPVTQLVLQGKERVEKIREQTQNIE